jgi:hypothetical protein
MKKERAENGQRKADKQHGRSDEKKLIYARKDT